MRWIKLVSVVVELGRGPGARPGPSLDRLTALTVGDIARVTHTIIEHMQSPVLFPNASAIARLRSLKVMCIVSTAPWQ